MLKLILARRRWLWIVGAVINALVILFFINLYQDRPEVLFSPGGLVSKAAQLSLEVVLIYLIVADWLRTHRPVHREHRGDTENTENRNCFSRFSLRALCALCVKSLCSL
jgi:hypothetical protein